ncbi:MAG: MFS transporter [Anaerolineaceae bacterium]
MEVAIPKAKTRAHFKPATRRERWAWYLYDFGNSAYAAVVILAVYSSYFKNTVVGGTEGTRLWGLSVGIAMLVVAVISPILGSLADFSGTKKRFLLIFTIVSCVFTALLFFVGPGDVWMGMLFFVLAEIGYRGAQVFYNSLLPEIASPKDMGRVSGNAWAFGSFGGIVCLAIVMGLIMLVGNSTIHYGFLITAVFFALSSLPTFLWIKERAEPETMPAGETYLSIPFKRLGSTFKELKNFKEFIKFIVAFLIYNDGIMMTLDFAAIIGGVLVGMDQMQLIIFMIIVQITSVAGAYLFGILTDKIGSKQTLVVSLIMMILTVSCLFLVQDVTFFFVIGGFAGFALSGVQSVSRMAVGKMAPEGKSAEFYGFFAVAGHTSSFIGPTIYGWLAADAAIMFLSRGMNSIAAEQAGIRAAVLSIIAFLAIGMVLLLSVKEKKPQDLELEETIGEL